MLSGYLLSESPWERLAILMITLWPSHFGHRLRKSSSIAETLSTREVSRTAIFAFINWYGKDATGIGYLSTIQFGKEARIQAAQLSSVMCPIW
jgi:hypothetical protein